MTINLKDIINWRLIQETYFNDNELRKPNTFKINLEEKY